MGIIDPGQRRVEAGWVVEYDLASNRLTGRQCKDMSHYHQWRTGMLQFSGEPLYKVVGELNRYSAKKILIEDTAIMDLEVYAALRVDRLESALMGLEQGNPIKVSRYFDRIVIVGSR